MVEPHNNIQIARQKLFDAINDYPKANLVSPFELLIEINKSIPSPITHEKLLNYSKKIDLSTNAWEAEAITSLIEIFKGFENRSLEEIIKLVTQSDNPL